MKHDPIYILDANVFIEAKNRYYAFDIVPAFWDNLILHSAKGSIKCIDRIKEQLEEGKDELAKWIAGGHLAKHTFVDSGIDEVIKSYQEVISWVQANTQAGFSSLMCVAISTFDA